MAFKSIGIFYLNTSTATKDTPPQNPTQNPPPCARLKGRFWRGDTEKSKNPFNHEYTRINTNQEHKAFSQNFEQVMSTMKIENRKRKKRKWRKTNAKVKMD